MLAALNPALAPPPAAGARGARGADCLVQEILEVDAGTLEARGVHVGQVVRDGVEIELLRLHPGR